MSASRKDYEAVAAALRKALDDFAHDGPRAGVHHAAVQVANAFEAGNPRFDRHRFLAACGIRARTPVVREVQHTAETCPGRPCSAECSHVEFVRP